MPILGEYFALCKFTVKQCNLGRLQVGTVLNKDQKQRFFFCAFFGQIGVRTLNK